MEFFKCFNKTTVFSKYLKKNQTGANNLARMQVE